MKKIGTFLALIAAVGLTFLLEKGVGGTPPFGKLLSPFEGFWHNSETDMYKYNQAVKLEGLTSNEVKVVYDDRLVPHVFAQNIEDALMVQGYLHAQHRLFEMDFISRVAGGQLSEILGDRELRKGTTTVDIDKLMRRRGLARSAESTLKSWQADKTTWGVVEAYCKGVNAYLKQLDPKDYPLEYKILGIKPKTWTALHTALFVKYMALDLSFRQNDIEATNAKNLLGATDFDFLYPEYFDAQDPIVPKGTGWTAAAAIPLSAGNTPLSMSDKKAVSETLSLIDIPKIHALLMPDENNGSNNWAVAPQKTRDKKPILCGDPHLGLRMPSIWYEMQISTPEQNTYGVSFPGVPAIVIGFNDNVAWSPTNVGHDVADWYTIKWNDKTHNSYTLDGQTKQVEIRVETLEVKGKMPVYDTVRYTYWGPVVYDTDTTAAYGMALHWLANVAPETDFNVFLKLNKAKNYNDYAEALKGHNTPAQNFAFACKDGDIALHVNGLYPIKEKGQGRFVQDGSTVANAWKGYIGREAIPKYKNPARGFVSSANQNSTDPSYPYYYNSEEFDGYRGRAVNRRLAENNAFTVNDMMLMQNDNFSVWADDALPPMFANIDEAALSAAEKAILDELKGWNRYFDAEKIAPIYFNEWWNEFYNATFDEILEQQKAYSILRPRKWRLIEILQKEPQNKFFDKKTTADKVETAKDILTATFKTMVANYGKLQAENAVTNPQDPKLTWARYKNTRIPHIANLPGFGREGIMNGGNNESINSVKAEHGPSWRMIVELGDKPRAMICYPGGQSGNPGSPHYDDFVKAWSEGAYYEAVFMQKADEQNTHIRFTSTFQK